MLTQLKLPFAHIDLYAEIDENGVQDTLLEAIGDILYSIEPTPKKAFNFITNFFSSLSIGFIREKSQVRVQFSKGKVTPAKNILTSLKKLDDILQAKNKTIVLFIDECQRLTQISETATIEGALRHVAQSSKNIVFVFSGSNRHLLSTMFDDKNKPLYKLCDRIILNRISQTDYLPFIQEKSKLRWRKILSNEIIELILDITELHPYYVNVLCYKLWQLNHLPIQEEVENIWHKYAIEVKTNILNEIDLLSANQGKMLIAIAKCEESILPMSKEFLSLSKFSLSSASQAISALEQKDYIYKDQKNRYFIIDPLIKYIYSRGDLKHVESRINGLGLIDKTRNHSQRSVA